MAWGSGILKQGSRGDDVRRLQQWLADNGFNPGPIDGIYGSQTAAAVRAFQQARGFAVDGIVGPETWSGITGGSPDSGQPGPSSEDERLLQQLRDSEFGPFITPYLEIDELRPILLKGAREFWTREQFEAQIRGTEWFRRNNQAQRTWQTLTPADREALISQAETEMMTYVEQVWGRDFFIKDFGSPEEFLRRNRSSAIAVASGAKPLELWKFEMMQRALSNPQTEASIRDLQRREELARLARRPEEIAEQLWREARTDYFIRIDERAARTWADRIISGQASFADFYRDMRRQASEFYPFIADDIENGVLPRQRWAHVPGIIASELETSEEEVLFDDDIFGQIVAQAAGASEPFTAQDWRRYARSLPRWERTSKALNETADLGLNVLRAFEAIPG